MADQEKDHLAEQAQISERRMKEAVKWNEDHPEFGFSIVVPAAVGWNNKGFFCQKCTVGWLRESSGGFIEVEQCPKCSGVGAD